VKGKRFLSILATAIILAMLIAVIPAAPVLAAENISVSPSSGEIGDHVSIDGTGFIDGEDVYFYFSSDSSGSDGDEIDTLDAYEFVDSDTADGDGDVSASFHVPDELTDGDDAPEDVENGTYYVYATYDDDEIVDRDSFTVGGGGTGNESISVIPTSAEIDEYVEIEGTHFEAHSTVYFYFSKESASVGDRIDSDVQNYERVESADANSSGNVSGYFYVPDTLTDGDEDEDVVSGTYYVYATYENDDDIVARDTITITASSISISPTKGGVGTKVKVTGSGFEDRESITIKFGSSTVSISEGNEETSSSGGFTSYFLVPESTAGDHTVTAKVHNDEAEADFEVEPAITIDPAEGAANERITVTGTGFASQKNVTITIGGEEVGGDETDSSGSFEAQVNVPDLGAGTFDVKAEDESDNSASATFKVITEVSVSPTTSVNSPGHVGQDLTISGSGFKPSSEIEIVYESTPVVVANPISGADGSFSATFEVPTSVHGEHTITATDGTSTASVAFYMESTPPDTPPPLLPYMDGKASSKAHFEWEAVNTDIDGVVEQSLPITYQLQIATDPEFANILVDKKDIEITEYTLTEDEALESTSDEIPYYYWRLRAVDAASNASQWTGTGQFKVGFTFSFPSLSGWLLYLLIGIGALVLFFVGFWIGRRGGGGEYY